MLHGLCLLRPAAQTKRPGIAGRQIGYLHRNRAARVTLIQLFNALTRRRSRMQHLLGVQIVARSERGVEGETYAVPNSHLAIGRALLRSMGAFEETKMAHIVHWGVAAADFQRWTARHGELGAAGEQRVKRNA